jgi:hypothetical protein
MCTSYPSCVTFDLLQVFRQLYALATQYTHAKQHTFTNSETHELGLHKVCMILISNIVKHILIYRILINPEDRQNYT